MAVDHKRIKELLGETEPSADTSLQSYSLRRATQKLPPRTLTPFEWEQWYSENGVPASHKSSKAPAVESFWQRLKNVLAGSGSGR